MKNILFVISLILTSIVSYSQTTDVFRMVGSGTWSTLNDSSYQATVNFFSDLTGEGYLANSITTSFRLFTNTGQVYRIDSVGSTTFSSAFLRIVEYGTTQNAPTGQSMVYDPNGKETVPQCPFGSTGSTAQLQAAIDTYNASLSGAVTSGNAITVSGSTVNLGGAMTGNANITATGDTILFTGTNSYIKADESARMRTENFELERGANTTSTAIIYMTVAVDLNLAPEPDGTVKMVTNASGSTISIDPVGVTKVNNAQSMNLPNGASTFLVYNSTLDDWVVFGGTSTSSLSYRDSLVSGSVTVWVERLGGSTTVLSSPAAGEYNITPTAGAIIRSISIKGDNTNLNGSNEMIIRVINSTNNRTYRTLAQLYDANNGALVDQQVTGTNHTRTISGATTVHTFPGMNGFGATGYYIEIR